MIYLIVIILSLRVPMTDYDRMLEVAERLERISILQTERGIARTYDKELRKDWKEDFSQERLRLRGFGGYHYQARVLDYYLRRISKSVPRCPVCQEAMKYLIDTDTWLCCGEWWVDMEASKLRRVK